MHQLMECPECLDEVDLDLAWNSQAQCPKCVVEYVLLVTMHY